jgi:hypothetical protein
MQKQQSTRSAVLQQLSTVKSGQVADIMNEGFGRMSSTVQSPLRRHTL